MSKNVIIGIVTVVAIVLFIGMLTYSSMHGVKYRANVRVAFQGRTDCRTASADSLHSPTISTCPA